MSVVALAGTLRSLWPRLFGWLRGRSPVRIRDATVPSWRVRDATLPSWKVTDVDG